MELPLGFVQVLRGICILVAPYTIFMCMQLILSDRVAPHRKWTFGGIVLLSIGSIATRFERWEQPADLSLFVETAGVILIAIGIRKMRFFRSKDV